MTDYILELCSGCRGWASSSILGEKVALGCRKLTVLLSQSCDLPLSCLVFVLCQVSDITLQVDFGAGGEIDLKLDICD